MNSLPHHITVLKGGPSAEREVSLRSGTAAAEALREAGFTVTEVIVDGPDFELPVETELVFLALHGTFGEDGQVQQILDARGLRYTGANAEVSAIAFDKEKTKACFRAYGVPTPEGQLITHVEEITLPLPLFVKPNAQGSSVGSHPVLEASALAPAVEEALRFGDSALVERFIQGRELTVGVLGGHALPLVEIRPLAGFYDYKNKYTKGNSEYFCPAPLTPELTAKIQELALLANKAVGNPMYSRIDFLLDADATPFCLEVNTLPGMTATSLLPKAAAAAGISFPELCRNLVELAWVQPPFPALPEQQGELVYVKRKGGTS